MRMVNGLCVCVALRVNMPSKPAASKEVNCGERLKNWSSTLTVLDNVADYFT